MTNVSRETASDQDAYVLAQVRELRAQGMGNRRIGKELTIKGKPIGKDAALRLLKKIELEDARKRQTGAISVAEPTIEPSTPSEYAARITACWHRSREAYIEAGRLLCAAKASLDHGEFQSMVDTLPFRIRKAEMLMAIYRDQRFVNPQYVALLPNELGTLYELKKLENDAFEARIADGTIRPDMERKDVAGTIKREARERREANLGAKIANGNLTLPTKRYGVILADPGWKFDTWGEGGMDRAPDNHYATTEISKIIALPVQDIAATDCVLFLWATAPRLPDALLTMHKWGFVYKTHAIWNKVNPITGYWFRNVHELILVGTRGDFPAPAQGTQPVSIFSEARTDHSVKPSFIHDLINKWFPSLPKIELNSRHARPGWYAWGMEAPGAKAE